MSRRPPLGARCFVFDFDGTLVDSVAIKRSGYFEVLRDRPGAAELLEELLREHPRDDRSQIFARAHRRLSAAGAASLPPVEDWVRAYASRCEAEVIRCPARPGAESVLAELSRSLPLYLASATPEASLARVVEGRGWTRWFRGVFGGPRPKEENLERVRVAEGLDPDAIVFVGDEVRDREAAEAFGCRFLGIGSDAAELPAGPLGRLVGSIAAQR